MTLPPRDFAQLLAEAQPRLPIEQLVVAVNRLFHEVEARHYERRHPEVHEQLPPRWREMIAVAREARGSQPWRVLDFGCGAGFEAGELLSHAPVEALVGYDLSPAMVAICRRKFVAVPSARFVEDLAELGPPQPKLDVLATNSLVHHLPSVESLIEQVDPWLAPGAVWLAGHEPSRRFYTNAACLALLGEYRRWLKSPAARARRWLAPRAWRERAARWMQTSPKEATALLALDRGLFGRPPTPHLIDRLVDFHVAHSADEASAGRGLDLAELAARLAGRWRLLWHRSYGYLGPHYEGSAPAAWQARCRGLGEQFPDDGSNFCAVWQRVG